MDTAFPLLFDLVEPADAPLAGAGIWPLPGNLGTGTMQRWELEAGLTLALYQCTFAQELTLTRPAAPGQAERWLLTFTTWDVPSRRLSSAQLSSSTIAFTTVLPAHTPLFMVGVAVDKRLLLSWLNPADGPPPAVLAATHPVVFDALQTPEIQLVLAQLAEPRATQFQDSFFYNTKTRELLYFLLLELAKRATPARYLNATDVAKVFQARTLLLAAWQPPPSLAGIARQVGLRPPVLQQLFHHVFGASLYQYFQTARLEEATRLLHHHSVAEVGYQLGFTNLGHFARLFAKRYQLTPKKYQATYLRPAD